MNSDQSAEPDVRDRVRADQLVDGATTDMGCAPELIDCKKFASRVVGSTRILQSVPRPGCARRVLIVSHRLCQLPLCSTLILQTRESLFCDKMCSRTDNYGSGSVHNNC